jgi:hypothetical protein
VKHRVWLALAGSMAFWLPLVLLEVFSRNGNFNIVLANTIPLLTVAGLYWVLRKRHPDEGRVMSLSFLAGIYGLGPLMIWLAWKCARRRLRRVSWTTLALLVASIFGPAALHPLFGYVEWYARGCDCRECRARCARSAAQIAVVNDNHASRVDISARNVQN